MHDGMKQVLDITKDTWHNALLDEDCQDRSRQDKGRDPAGNNRQLGLRKLSPALTHAPRRRIDV